MRYVYIYIYIYVSPVNILFQVFLKRKALCQDLLPEVTLCAPLTVQPFCRRSEINDNGEPKATIGGVCLARRIL